MKTDVREIVTITFGIIFTIWYGALLGGLLAAVAIAPFVLLAWMLGIIQ